MTTTATIKAPVSTNWGNPWEHRIVPREHATIGNPRPTGSFLNLKDAHAALCKAHPVLTPKISTDILLKLTIATAHGEEDKTEKELFLPKMELGNFRMPLIFSKKVEEMPDDVNTAATLVIKIYRFQNGHACKALEQALQLFVEKFFTRRAGGERRRITFKGYTWTPNSKPGNVH